VMESEVMWGGREVTEASLFFFAQHV
jgi:hypothetical protein